MDPVDVQNEAFLKRQNGYSYGQVTVTTTDGELGAVLQLHKTRFACVASCKKGIMAADKLEPLDRIIAVDGETVFQVKHAQALMSKARYTLLLERPITEDAAAECKLYQQAPSPASDSTASSSESSDSVDNDPEHPRLRRSPVSFLTV